MKSRIVFFFALAASLGGSPIRAQLKPLTPDERAKIEAAVPSRAPVRVQKPRRMLVFSMNVSKRKPRAGHPSIPAAQYALELMGKKTRAFEPVFSDDINMLRWETLRTFDVVCFNNTTGVLTENRELVRSLLDFVRSGKGFVAIHAGGGATFVEYPEYGQFPEFGAMVGGYEDGGHAYAPNSTVHIRVEDPKSPLNAAFLGKGFMVRDEIYQFRHGYSRENVRVLLSVDTEHPENSPMRKPLPERAVDKDFPVSWIKNYGRGRVFYFVLGHHPEIFMDPALLRHLLAGIQFAAGDLKADTTPSAKIHRN
ncbi:MAG: ThuA domain-containing protein [Bryobacteraceae bacterium]